MSPLERYYFDLKHKKGFSHDPVQATAVHYTHRLFLRLLQQDRSGNVLDSLLRYMVRRKKPKIKGLYFWGGVGRGKSYLIDCFYQCLPFDAKWRIHFHRFMQYIHNELKQLKQTKDPLQIVASTLAERVRVLCLDEFYVEDIADAMLLAGLLKALFDHGIVLVASSNIAPDQLYYNGLQRARFTPAIALIKQHVQVFHFNSGTDYRLRFLDKTTLYYHPADAHAKAMLAQDFNRIAATTGVATTLTINDRALSTIRCSDSVAWFDFSALCIAPCGVTDYIELARCFQTVLIEAVPIMTDAENDQARRFISLIDEFYDRGVKLIIAAAASPKELYQGQRLKKTFERTVSRLQEMRTHDYLARRHRP